MKFWTKLQNDLEIACKQVRYLDLLSCQSLQLSLLSNGEVIDEDLWSSSDGYFEVVTVLLNLGDAL